MSTPALPTVGVLGLGIIGSIWAGHYAAAGRLAGTWNRTPRPDAPHPQPTPLAVAQGADVVQIVVADPPAVRDLLSAIRPALGPGRTVVQSSTIDPASAEAFAAEVTAAGARYVEAPFTGSKVAAGRREVVYYLGGEPASVDAIEPLLALVSGHRFRIGTVAQAASLKLAMNLNIAGIAQALCESLAFARASGLSDDTFFGVLARNVGQSGFATLKEPKLRSGDFSPQFSVKHLHKDLRLALETAAARGQPRLPLTDAVRQRLALAELAGHGDDDFVSLLRLL